MSGDSKVGVVEADEVFKGGVAASLLVSVELKDILEVVGEAKSCGLLRNVARARDGSLGSGSYDTKGSWLIV